MASLDKWSRLVMPAAAAVSVGCDGNVTRLDAAQLAKLQNEVAGSASCHTMLPDAPAGKPSSVHIACAEHTSMLLSNILSNVSEASQEGKQPEAVSMYFQRQGKWQQAELETARLKELAARFYAAGLRPADIMIGHEPPDRAFTLSISGSGLKLLLSAPFVKDTPAEKIVERVMKAVHRDIVPGQPPGRAV